MAALLFLVHDAEHPVDGVCCLRIEDLLFVCNLVFITRYMPPEGP